MVDANPSTSKTKVMVVEDSVIIRMTMVDMLEEIGIPCAEAGDGPQALGILAIDKDIDVLMTDLGLPGMSGLELAQQALELRPHLKIIVASGYSEPAAGSSGELRQAVYLQKPFTLAQLRKALDT